RNDLPKQLQRLTFVTTYQNSYNTAYGFLWLLMTAYFTEKVYYIFCYFSIRNKNLDLNNSL
ncbi:MAG TPA: hypothetical protein PKK70_03185, partial [Candidatus Paceibacterota bacterium]|nr:hypothetical protein [Candidatus Paceibacterota bacterium]